MSKAKRSRAKTPTEDKALRNATQLHRVDLGGLPVPFIDHRQQAVAHELVKRYGRHVHRCMSINSETAAAIRPRLFSLGNSETVEKCYWLKPKRLDRATKMYLRGEGHGGIRPGVVARKAMAAAGDDMTEITEHGILNLLSKVNPWDDGFSFRDLWFRDLQLFGRLFSQIVVDGGLPSQLWRADPRYMRVLPHEKDFIAGFEYQNGTVKFTYEPEDIFWVRLPHMTDPWGGYGWVEAWLKTIDADFAMVAFQDWLFKQGGQPDIWVITKQAVPDTLKRQFRTEHKASFGNMTNRRENVGFLSGDVTDIKEFGGKPQEMQYFQSRNQVRDEIAEAAGVPKSLLTTDDVNKANAHEGNPTHIRNTVWPMMMRVEDALNQRLVTRWSEQLVLCFENPLKEDQTIRAADRSSRLDSGYSINEERIRDGEEPLDDPLADEPMIASTRVPLSMAGMQGLGGMGAGATMEASGQAEPTVDQPAHEPAAEQSTAVATNDLRATVGGSAAILSLQEAYYGGQIPRDAAIGNAVLVFGFEQSEAEKLFPEAPPDAPKSEQQLADEEAARQAMANPGNGAGNGNDDKPASGKAHAHDARGAAGEMDAVSGVHKHRADQKSDRSDNDGNGHCQRCGSTGKTQQHDAASAKSALYAAWETKDDRNPRPLTDAEHARVVRALEGIFNGQSEAVAAALLSTSRLATVEDMLAVIADPKWQAKIEAAIRPFLTQQVTRGGRAGIRELQGMGAELPSGFAFDVTNPRVQEFVDQYTVRLSSAVQGHTQHRLSTIIGDALEQGETAEQVAARVREWGGPEMSESRATNIARTESARAFNQGAEQSWKESGVVQGKEWLLAPDPCEFCEAAAEAFANKATALGQAFYRVGDRVVARSGAVMEIDYADVEQPPLHPQCRCTTIPVLVEE